MIVGAIVATQSHSHAIGHISFRERTTVVLSMSFRIEVSFTSCSHKKSLEALFIEWSHAQEIVMFTSANVVFSVLRMPPTVVFSVSLMATNVVFSVSLS